jgi:hypothetical protein
MSKRFDPDELGLPTPQELSKAFAPFQELVNKAFGLRHAILDESGNVVPIEVYDENHDLIEAKLIEWAMFFEKNKQRYIQQDLFKDHLVSTVFLGLNHQNVPYGRPLWFETMTFKPAEEIEFFGSKKMMRPSLDFTRRTETRAEALEAHAEGVAWLKDYLHAKAKAPESL